MHRQQGDADVHRGDPQTGGRERADRGAARHGVVGDEVLAGDLGIVPDIEVKPTVKGLAEGRDELLEKAIEVVEKESLLSTKSSK